MNITPHMNYIINTHGEPERIFVTRDHDRDLTFQGWLIGSGETGDGQHRCDWNAGTRVKIYLTKGGHLVVSIERWSRWEGRRDSNDAHIFKGDDAPLDMLEYLKDDCDGVLGRASKEAWEDIALAFFPIDEDLA